MFCGLVSIATIFNYVMLLYNIWSRYLVQRKITDSLENMLFQECNDNTRLLVIREKAVVMRHITANTMVINFALFIQEIKFQIAVSHSMNYRYITFKIIDNIYLGYNMSYNS